MSGNALTWARLHAESQGCTALSQGQTHKGFQDGQALLALCDALCGTSLFSQDSADSSASACEQRCELGLKTLEERLGVPRLIDAEDLVEFQDRHSIITYLQQVHAKSGAKAPAAAGSGSRSRPAGPEKHQTATQRVGGAVAKAASPQKNATGTTTGTGSGSGSSSGSWEDEWAAMRDRDEANRVCFECRSGGNAVWASVSLGAFLCIECSGRHRSAGVHISRVKSCTLDRWTESDRNRMRHTGGNQRLWAFLAKRSMAQDRDLRNAPVAAAYQEYARSIDAALGIVTRDGSNTAANLCTSCGRSLGNNRPKFCTGCGASTRDTIAAQDPAEQARVEKIRARAGATGIGSDDIMSPRDSQKQEKACCIIV